MSNKFSDEHYRKALLIRQTEDTFLNLFNEGKMNGTVHTCSGQEFSALAFTDTLQPDDFIFSNHRCHGHYLAKTGDVAGLIAELMGKESGTCGGVGSSQHLCNKNFYSNGIQGGILPVSAGMALSSKINGGGHIGLVFMGDGTLGEGVVYETMNLISLLDIPLLIICENNQYAQSTKIEKNLAGSILARPEAFGIKTFHSNTWDPENLFLNAAESIEYVRGEIKPAFHLVDTYRLNHHSKSDDNRDPQEVDKYALKDPLNKFKTDNPESFEAFQTSANKLIEAAVKDAETEKELSGEEYAEIDLQETADVKASIGLENIQQRVVSRINAFFDEAIENDKNILFLGEDILSPYGGAFKISAGLSDKFPKNVISTPISEGAIAGISNGLALAGKRPFLEIMFGDFMTLCFDQIVNHASKFHHMYNKKVNCPVVFRTPMGGGRGYGPTHSQTLDKHLVGIDNVKVFAINSFIDPYSIYQNIYLNEDHPVIVIENKIDYARFVGDKKNNFYELKRSDDTYPHVLCSPKSAQADITLVTYGGISSDVFSQLDEIFLETELIPEVIILSQISPINVHPILNSVSVTKKIIFVEEGGKDFGIGAEVIARVAEELGPQITLCARIAALAVPIPSARKTEEYVLPNTSIAKKINVILKK
jgi:2-oxoisovalerate dehydrogenase E1 component